MMRYKAVYKLIEPQIYQHLRIESGLSPKSDEAAAIGMQHSLCCVAIVDQMDGDQIVGMGRLVGDGACHCQVVDICVLPNHQKQGLGKLIMQKLSDYIENNFPTSCNISLIADGEAYRLYEQYGFTSVWPASRGMGLKK